MDDRLERQEPPLIRGSWEDLFAQAMEIGADDPEEAIRLYYRVFNGLGRIPIARRLAGGGQLQKLHRQCTGSLVSMLIFKDRFDEAVGTLAQAVEHEDEDESSYWKQMMADILILDNRLDDAHALMRQLVHDDLVVEAYQWEPLITAYIRAGMKSEAAASLAEAQSWLEARYGPNVADVDDPDALTDQMRRDIAYAVWLKGLFAISAQEWHAALDCFYEVLRLDAPHLAILDVAYSHFLAFGRYEEAQALIRRDAGFPIRTGFWKGLIEQEQGHSQKAIGHWKRVSDMRITEEPSSLPAYVLAHYYLGDPDTLGLGMMEYFIEEIPAAPWPIHFLAGIGQALTGDVALAHISLKLAQSMRKSMAEGLLLPYKYYLMIRGLPFDHDLSDELRGYFESAPQPLAEN